MASAKEYSILYKLGAELSSGFTGTFTKAQAQIAATQKEIQGLSKTQSDISSFQKQQNAVEASKHKLEVLQQQYDNIQKEIQETEGYSSSLENKLLSKQQQIDRTAASLGNQTRKLEEMERALQEAGVDTGNLTGESARLASQIDELKQKQEQAAESAEGFGDAGADAFADVKNALVAAGLVAGLHEIAEAYMECVSIAGDFEEAMSTVEALSGATPEEMAALSEQAKELGATTKFTAKEAADAMGYMGMAGWDAADMLQGMDGVLQLAAASGEDLAMVSDIVTDNLTAFGLKASDTAHFSDVLAAAATNSNTNVAIMGETFKQSASIAGALGFSIEDVATAVGLMANSGVKGSIAGTALKNTFNGLLEGATFTAEAFGEYEYSAIQADGTMKNFRDTMDELREVFGQMTEAERVNNAMLLAGKRGYNGLLAILNATEEDYASLASSIDNCTGAAAKMANIKLDNMNGQLTIAKSAWDGLKISIGEQFAPAMQEFYEIEAQVFSAINDFVKKYPGVVKAIAAIVAGVAAATATILGAVAAVQAAKLATAAWNAVLKMNPIVLVTSAVVGLGVAVGALAATYEDCQSEYEAMTATSREQYNALQDLQAEYEEVRDTMGETSAEAQLLKRELDDATAAFEENKQTAEEVAANYNAFMDAHNELMASYQESVEGINKEARSSEALVAKLEELMEVEGKTAETKQQILAVVDLLNEAMPQLGLAYDQYADSLNMSADAIRAVVAAEIERERHQADWEKLKQFEREKVEAENALAAATVETTNRQKEYEKAAKAAAEAQNGLNSDPGRPNAANRLSDSAEEAKKALEEAQAQEEGYRAALEESQAALDELSTSLAGYTDEHNTSAGAVVDRINETGAAMQALTEKYTEAYAAAQESVTGQYEIWDQADKVIATSVGSINANLESQTKYWNDYNANLASLRDRTGDIEGLREVIASFADGSPESVNAIAGMAKATDAELAKMVADYQELQEAQGVTAESIAEMKTDYENQMAELASGLEADIEDLDFSTEAAEAARATIQGYIDGATNKLPGVRAAYSLVGTTAQNALGNHQNKTYSGSYFDIPGHASGTRNAQPGPAEVGENGPELMFMRGVETILDAQHTREIIRESNDVLRLVKEAEGLGVGVPRGGDANRTEGGVALVGATGPEVVYMQGGETVLPTQETSAVLRDYREVIEIFNQIEGLGISGAYADGTDYAQPGVALVGENGPELVLMHGGESVLTAQETQVLMREYAEMQQVIKETYVGNGASGYGTDLAYEWGGWPGVTLRSDPEPTSVIPHDGGGFGGDGGNPSFTIKVEVKVEGNASQETVDALDDKAEEIADMAADKVMERLEGEERDRERRAYR